MNKFGMASPTAILTLLEETAAGHCDSIGYGLYELEDQGIGWVLISGAIDMIRYPVYKETITIRTWISKYSLVKGYRENLILDGDRNIIGRAKGIWAFYDIKNRRPVPVFEEIKSSWGLDEEVSTRANNEKALMRIDDGFPEMELDIYRSDIDGNKHVNNIRYFHWMIESMPEEIVDNYYLKLINAKFISEAPYGGKIQVFLKHGPDRETFSHTMKNTLNGKLCVIADSSWQRLK